LLPSSLVYAELLLLQRRRLRRLPHILAPLIIMDAHNSTLDMPQHYFSGDGVMTGPASARTSRTRVDQTTTIGSAIDPLPDSTLHTEREVTGHHEHDVEPEVPSKPQASVTFLLISGRRRTMLFQPDVTVARVKELLWNGWPSDWQDERPPAPLYLRLLYLGRMLQDDETFTKLNLPTHVPQPPDSAPPSIAPPSTIVHLSIRPYAPVPEDDLQKKKVRRRRGRSDGESDGEEITDSGCCSSCVIS